MKTLKITEKTHTSLWLDKIDLAKEGAKGLKTLDDVIRFLGLFMYENNDERLEIFIENWNKNEWWKLEDDEK